MGKPSSAAKRRWNKKNYDTYMVSMPKGQKERLKTVCQQNGVSMNSVFVAAADRYLEDHPPK